MSMRWPLPLKGIVIDHCDLRSKGRATPRLFLLEIDLVGVPRLSLQHDVVVACSRGRILYPGGGVLRLPRPWNTRRYTDDVAFPVGGIRPDGRDAGQRLLLL
jgi:hypothetical protein